MSDNLRYFKDFNTYDEYVEYINNDPTLPNVSFVDLDVYYKDGLPSDRYLTFEIVSGLTGNNNVLRLMSTQSGYSVNVLVKVNNGEWVNKQFGYEDIPNTLITGLSVGDKIRFKGTNNVYSVLDSEKHCYFDANDTMFVNIEGNIMSLIYGDDFKDKTTFPSNTSYNFRAFFYHKEDSNFNVINAQNLILPATKLTNGCYRAMFQDHSWLVTTPELPATKLIFDCYKHMFLRCESLKKAPKLPATTLGVSCYYYMFRGCTSLVTPPELPATTLANYCYLGMFQECTSLVNTPKLPATTLAIDCYRGMFQGCTSLVATPELSATTLVENCYRAMFYGCKKLNYIKCLATDISASECTYSWVYGVPSTGTFVKKTSMEGWSSGTDGIPNGWDVQNA